MKTIIVPRNGMIRLPRRVFKPSEKVLVLAQGDTFIVKKLQPPLLSSFAGRVKERPMPMRDIVREVHAVRRSRRAR